MLLFLISLLLLADPPVKEQPKKLSEYKKLIDTANKWAENITKPETYKNFTFKENEKDKEKKYTELDAFQQKMFIVMQFENLTNSLEGAENDFTKDLNLFDKNAPLDKTDKDDEPAKKGNIDEYLKQLKVIRIKIATQYEPYAEAFFKEYKAKFPEKEIELYMKELKQFHDQKKLIQRK